MKQKTTLDPATDGKPKYLALVDMLEAEIADGKWKPGDRLPSNRELGAMFSVTVGTISKAMSEAARRGLIDTRVGSGTYVRAGAVPGDAAGRAYDLALNTLPTGIVADLLDATIAARFPRGVARDLFSYSVSYRAPRHQALGARWLTELGTPAREESVLLTAGVHHGLVAAFQTLLKPGERAVCEALTYTGIKRIADARGVALVGAAVDREGLVPEAVDRLLASTGATVVVVTPALQNPTGASMPLGRRRELAAICAKHDARVIEDAVNVPLAGDRSPSLAALAPERTIHLTGLSKCVASGFRLGYATMPASMLPAFHEALVAAQWIGPGFHAELAAAMDANGTLQQCIERHRGEAEQRAALARRLLPGAGGDGPPCYHLWIRVPPGTSAEELSAQAANAGVKVSPGRYFEVAGDAPAPEGLRVSLGACDTRAELSAALARLAPLLQQREGTAIAAAPAV